MGLEVGELREGFGAAVVPAFVGLVAGVCADVLLQVGQLGELSLADFTSEKENRILREDKNESSHKDTCKTTVRQH